MTTQFTVTYADSQLANNLPFDQEDYDREHAVTGCTVDVAGLALMVSINALLVADVVLWPMATHWAVVPFLNAPAILAFISAWRRS